MKQTNVMLSNTRDGVYHLIENFHGNGILITAQGLLELAGWVEQHRGTLEHEANKDTDYLLKCCTEEMWKYDHPQQEWRE